jgi:hypothetical protein
VLSVTLISRELLRVIRADPTGFVHRPCGCLRSSWSWIGSAGSNGGVRPRPVTQRPKGGDSSILIPVTRRRATDGPVRARSGQRSLSRERPLSRREQTGISGSSCLTGKKKAPTPDDPRSSSNTLRGKQRAKPVAFRKMVTANHAWLLVPSWRRVLGQGGNLFDASLGRTHNKASSS